MGDDHDDLRDRLERWDPAAKTGPPSPATRARVRNAMLGAGPASALPPWPVWAAAALVLAAAVVSWQLSRQAGTTPPLRPSADVRMQFRASNGTRIYWTVRPADARRTPSEDTDDDG